MTFVAFSLWPSVSYHDTKISNATQRDKNIRKITSLCYIDLGRVHGGKQYRPLSVLPTSTALLRSCQLCHQDPYLHQTSVSECTCTVYTNLTGYLEHVWRAKSITQKKFNSSYY